MLTNPFDLFIGKCSNKIEIFPQSVHIYFDLSIFISVYSCHFSQFLSSQSHVLFLSLYIVEPSLFCFFHLPVLHLLPQKLSQPQHLSLYSVQNGSKLASKTTKQARLVLGILPYQCAESLLRSRDAWTTHPSTPDKNRTVFISASTFIRSPPTSFKYMMLFENNMPNFIISLDRFLFVNVTFAYRNQMFQF